MKKYKFRAECAKDVEELQKLISFDIEVLEVRPLYENAPVPDVVVTIAMECIHLEQLRDYMKLIEDSHVMIQTLEAEQKYTGERNLTL